MPKPLLFQEDLINRYDHQGPRYSSYPPATEFHEEITESHFREWARSSNEELIPRPLSLYLHIPFCSSICYFCACNKVISQHKQEAEPYLQAMHREIEIQSRLFDQDREVRQLHWGGGTPGFLTQQQSQQLMNKIARHFKLSRGGEGDYSIEIDPRVMEPGGAAYLRNLGFNRISVGVQELNAKVQKSINRIQSLKSIETVIGDARRSGFRSINIDLMYGLPHQTVASFTTTLNTIIELEPDRIALYHYTHLPNRFPTQRRIKAKDLPDSSEKLAILQNATEQLCAAGYDHIGMDYFARPADELTVAQRRGRLRRNFRGYTAHEQCDSIGFGVSAISHVHENYSQNSISLDDYHESLDQQRLPVMRGHQSSDDDLLRREIIQRLSCQFRIDTRQSSKSWNIDFDEYFANEMDQLRMMAEEGLVEIADNAIRVLEPGRVLVHNICSVFDAYQRPETVAG